MKPHVYMMVTTTKSDHYTKIALDSFFANTKLSKLDQFYLIDNDATKNHYSDNFITIENNEPLCFSKNINKVINLSNDKDIFVLNNDIIFTPNWDNVLKQYDNIITIPSCNQTHFYQTNELTLAPTMSLNDFSNKFKTLFDIAKYHITNSVNNFFELKLMPFYAFRLPNKIYNKVGLFDENFERGGEDVDYRLRCIEQGFSVKFTNRSYLLHFHGKSTWDSSEEEAETLKRNKLYENVFLQKWGEDLFHFCLNSKDYETIIKKYQLEKLVQHQKYSEAINILLNNRIK